MKAPSLEKLWAGCAERLKRTNVPPDAHMLELMRTMFISGVAAMRMLDDTMVQEAETDAEYGEARDALDGQIAAEIGAIAKAGIKARAKN